MPLAENGPLQNPEPLGSVPDHLRWFLLGWLSAAVVSGVALVWASRYRRDRHRPTGGLSAMFDSLGGFSEIWSRDTYDTAKPTVVLILRASLIVAMALFVTGVVLGMRLP